MEHKVILAHLRDSLLEPVNFEKAKEEILKRSGKPFKTKTSEPPTDLVGTSAQAGPSAEAGPASVPTGTSAEAGPASVPTGTSAEAGPASVPTGTSAEAGPASVPTGTSAEAGPSSASAGLCAPIASSAGDSDSAIPASHFSFMSFMNSDLDQDYIYHTELGEDLDPWKQYRGSSQSLAHWNCDVKTERASVLQDSDLMKMEKYMGWAPEDQLAHLLSLFKKYLKEDMQREEKTYQNYVNKIEKLIGLLFKETGQTLPEMMSEKGLLDLTDVVKDIRGKSGEKLKQKTYQTHYSALKAFLIFLERKKYISREIKSNVEEEVSSKIASTAK